jgi:hypothetical protein
VKNIYNVTSYGQSGGVTAGVVNFGRPPRRLEGNENLKQQLREFPRSKPVDVVAQMGDAEAYQFGLEIRQFLISEGYDVPGPTSGLSTAMWSRPQVGLIKEDAADKTTLIVGSQPPD